MFITAFYFNFFVIKLIFFQDFQIQKLSVSDNISWVSWALNPAY